MTKGVEGIIWIFTARCNLSCRHCYVKPRFGRLVELPREEKLRLLSEAAELGVGYVGFSGGEPLLHPDFPRMVRECAEYGVETSVVTNAIRVPRELARLLSSSGTLVYVSLDGNRESHDRLRGQGAWDAAVRGLKTLLAEGVNVATVMAVNRENYRASADYVETAASLGLDWVALIPTMPSGKALSSGLYIRAQEYREAVERAAERAEELGVAVSLWCTPFAPLLTDHANVSFYSCRPADVVDLDPSGALLLCDVLDIVVARAPSLAQALEEYSRHPLVRLVTEPPSLPEPCNTCPLSGYCRGGCYARSLILRGGLNAGDPLCPRVSSFS